MSRWNELRSGFAPVVVLWSALRATADVVGVDGRVVPGAVERRVASDGWFVALPTRGRFDGRGSDRPTGAPIVGRAVPALVVEAVVLGGVVVGGVVVGGVVVGGVVVGRVVVGAPAVTVGAIGTVGAMRMVVWGVAVVGAGAAVGTVGTVRRADVVVGGTETTVVGRAPVVGGAVADWPVAEMVVAVCDVDGVATFGVVVGVVVDVVAGIDVVTVEAVVAAGAGAGAGAVGVVVLVEEPTSAIGSARLTTVVGGASVVAGAVGGSLLGTAVVPGVLLVVDRGWVGGGLIPFTATRKFNWPEVVVASSVVASQTMRYDPIAAGLTLVSGSIASLGFTVRLGNGVVMRTPLKKVAVPNLASGASN